MGAQEEPSVLLFCLPSSSPSMRGACERLSSHRQSFSPFLPSLPPSLPPSAYLKAVSSDKHSKTVKPKKTTAFKRTQNVCIFTFPCAGSCYVGTHVCKCGFAALASRISVRWVEMMPTLACSYSHRHSHVCYHAQKTPGRVPTSFPVPDDTHNHPLEPSPPLLRSSSSSPLWTHLLLLLLLLVLLRPLLRLPLLLRARFLSLPCLPRSVCTCEGEGGMNGGLLHMVACG